MAGDFASACLLGLDLHRQARHRSAALEDPLSVIISAQPPIGADLFSRLIDDGKSGADPRTIVRVYATPADCSDPFSEEAVRLANPGLDHFMNLRELLAEAAKAQRMPSFAASFKNLNLNMRIDTSTPFTPLRYSTTKS